MCEGCPNRGSCSKRHGPSKPFEFVDLEKIGKSETLDRIQKIMTEKEMPAEKIAFVTGLSVGDVTGYFQRPMDTKIDVFQKICEALKITMNHAVGEDAVVVH